tara:strand:+ start:1015 stop:1797 length:783 start_codon:yes stop_codon:yes gene_type:complete
MNWLLKNNILRILDETQHERSKLKNHPLYHSIKTEKHLHIFMENHVFAVWDFMSILKTLQSKLTCLTVPWVPKPNGNLSRLINEIVLAEESDVDGYEQYMSHFEMYYISMKEAGANTTSIDKFLKELKTADVFSALESSKAHQPAINFVSNTFKILESAPPHIAATMFTLGREEIIPDMFREIIGEINKTSNGKLKSLIYYLDRHIGLDEDEHTPAALKMIKELCNQDESKWKQTVECGKLVMQSRITFWDGILSQINDN